MSELPEQPPGLRKSWFMARLNDPPPPIVPAKIVTAVKWRLLLIVLSLPESGKYKSGGLCSCILSFKVEEERLQDIDNYREENTQLAQQDDPGVMPWGSSWGSLWQG